MWRQVGLCLLSDTAITFHAFDLTLRSHWPYRARELPATRAPAIGDPIFASANVCQGLSLDTSPRPMGVLLLDSSIRSLIDLYKTQELFSATRMMMECEAPRESSC